MASPFPGMDPYLEGELWQEFHATLASEIRAQLLPNLRPKYVALLEKRYVFDRPILGILEPPSARIVYPDVHVLERTVASQGTLVGQATPVIAKPTATLPALLVDEVPVTTIEIRDAAERRLVTVIEILSPVNKRGAGAEEYLRRRRELLLTNAHLLEIDLLLQGERIPVEGELPPAPYYVYLSRADHRFATDIWAMSLQERLPVVPVPLLRPDPDVPLDLQAAVDACFALVGYEDLLNYQAEPPPGLSAADRAWVQERLRGTAR
jgi:hypothetical protein